MVELTNHPDIMRIYDIFKGDKELFLILEYVEGEELFDFLVNRLVFLLTRLCFILVYGLHYAHSCIAI